MFYIGQACLPMLWKKTVSSKGVSKSTFCFGERHPLFSRDVCYTSLFEKTVRIKAVCSSAYMMCRNGKFVENHLLTDFSS